MPAPAFEASITSEGLHAMEMMTAMAAGKRTILICGVILAVCMGLVQLPVRPRFTADAEILPPQIAHGTTAAAMLSQSGMSPDLASLATSGGLVQAKSQTDLFVVILGAWPIQDQLVKSFNLVSVLGVHDAAAARRALAGRTSITGTHEGLIKISVTDGDRQRSAALANGYVEALRKFMRSLAITEASQRRVFYQDQMDRTRLSLQQAEQTFKATQQKSHMIALDSQARTLLDQVAALRSQITAKEVDLQSLMSYSTQVNPQVQIAETELGALRSHLAQVQSRTGDPDGNADSLSSVPGAELDFVRATRDLKYQENLYDLMVKQYEVALMDEARDAPIIQVIEPALVPDHKSGPHRVKNVLLAFLVGSFVGLIIVVVRSWRSGMSAENRARFAAFREALLRW